MIYFDSDVLINYFIEQDVRKNKQAIELYQVAASNKVFFCSVLSLMETSYVLSKVDGIGSDEITDMVRSIFSSATANCRTSHFNRAISLARKVGFRHINDCLHTAIAEEYCDELYTYNKSDFKRIQKHTDLKITIF